MVSLGEADFCDGPYDGGVDFVVREQRVGGLKVGIQLSIEKEWRKKIESDAKKAKRNHGVNVLYFVSSRRIPEATWSDVHADISRNHGVAIIKFDNQAIASQFIRRNAVGTLLQIFGVAPKVVGEAVSARGSRVDGPQNEAISALLMFGSDAKDFRDGVHDSLVKSFLAKHKQGLRKQEIITDVLAAYSMPDAHGVLINSHLDRLLQKQALISVGGVIRLSQVEQDLYEGLEAASAYEYEALRRLVEAFLHRESASIGEGEKRLLIDNLLVIATTLVSNEFTIERDDVLESGEYRAIRDLLSNRFGSDVADRIFLDLSKIVGESQFAKRVASAKLYLCLMNSNSSQLIAALGGKKGLQVYFDTQVFIPMLCGALFDPSRDRYGKSASDLFMLMKEHEFSPCLPSPYLEEAAAHLVDACRDYRDILGENVDIPRSSNGFVSHFSDLRMHGVDLTFDQYVETFGIRLGELSPAAIEEKYFTLLDRVQGVMARLAKHYGFDVLPIRHHPSEKRVRAEIDDLMVTVKAMRADILVRHDAVVAAKLGDEALDSDDAVVLCTWDKMHMDVVRRLLGNYHVMSPVGLIDFLAMAKRGSSSMPIAVLHDFMLKQTKHDQDLGAKIWDQIAKISGKDMSDAVLFLRARQFRDDYMRKHAATGLDSEEDIARSWKAWRNTL